MSFTPDLAPSVGGILEMHYAHPTLGPVYSMRLAVTTFGSAPSGPSNDYSYTGTGGFVPGEAGVLATFANVAACWQPYYGADWSLTLAGLWINSGGLAVPHTPVPLAPTISGTDASAPPPTPTPVKRILALYSTLGRRWRVFLRQLPAQAVGQTVGVAAASGGIDARDQAWYAYVSGSQSAIVGRDGTRMQAGGVVRCWWDTPPAPYLVSG